MPMLAYFHNVRTSTKDQVLGMWLGGYHAATAALSLRNKWQQK